MVSVLMVLRATFHGPALRLPPDPHPQERLPANSSHFLITAIDTTAQARPDAAAAPGRRPTAGESTRNCTAGTETGTYIQNIPPGAERPLPMVLDVHGFMEPAFLEHSGTGSPRSPRPDS
ncbi:hypothetical protein [Nocardia higoensis]|uniref:hypothetical protein n=1 Tax=Nocardia higoensis TaxID=228599 RepID=UPI0012F6A330|nr:hypothetical protein [Nocardia higoensis]